MNREEEIEERASEYAQYDAFANCNIDDVWRGFVEGAQWADERKTAVKRLHNIWHGMKQRCNNPHATGYCYYGEKGIKVCKEWSAFIPFAKWALANGYTNSLSIDRIDSNKDYEPSNCRWVTAKTQCNNTSRNVKVSFKGTILTIGQLASMYGINYRTLHNRIFRGGWSVEYAIMNINGRKANLSSPVDMLTLDGLYIKTYPSISEARKEHNSSHITDVCRGVRKSALGYIWRYSSINKKYGNK